MTKQKAANNDKSIWEQSAQIRIQGLTEAAHRLNEQRRKQDYRQLLSEAVQAEIRERLAKQNSESYRQAS